MTIINKQTSKLCSIINKTILASAIAAMISQPIISSANDFDNNKKNECYIKLAFGASKSRNPNGFYNSKVNNANLYNIGFGGDLVANNRIEINYIKYGNLKNVTKHQNMYQIDSIKANIKSNTFMLNIYSDQHISEDFILYFGAGLGYSKNNVKFSRSTSLDNNPDSDFYQNSAAKKSLAWQFALGFNLPIHEKIALDFSYRYSHLGKLPYPTEKVTVLGNKASGKLRTQALLFGMHFKI